MHVLVGQCYDLMATPPYGLWLDLARSYADLKGDEDVIPLPPVLSSGGLYSVSNQSEIFDQVRTFLGEVSAGRPTIVVLEDVHWADPVSLELIRHIASRLAHTHLCVVITYRVDELTQQNPLYRQLPSLIRESGGLRIDLLRLHREDLDRLVEIQYPMHPNDRKRLVDFLLAHSEGNPFFAVELLRALEGRGMGGGLWRVDDAWQLAQLEPLVVPALVRQVIDLRLERLGVNLQAPLALAAVIGQDVQLDLWQAIAALDEASFLEIVDVAVEWHIMTPSADGTRIRFVHALTREALYTGISPPRRRLHHRAVAEALIQLPGVDPDAVANHLLQAGDDRTAEWMIRAGERAQRAYAWLTAWDRFSKAAEALADRPGQESLRARLLYRCGRLLRYANPDQGIEDISLAQRLAWKVGDTVLAADAEYSLGLLQCYADTWMSGVQTMEAGIRRVEDMPSESEQVDYSSVTWFADALPAIEMPAQAGIDPAAVCLAGSGVNHRRGGLPWFLAHSGHTERAIFEAESFLAHVERCGRGPLVLSAAGHACFGLGTAHAAKGKPGQARAAFAAARELYFPLDHHAVIAFTLLTELQEVVLRYYTNDLPQRQRLASEARAALERAGGAMPLHFSRGRADLPLMWLEGRWGEARNVVAESTSFGNSMLRRPVTNSIALIDYHQGRSEAVWAHIRSLLPDGPASEPGSAVLADALLLQSLAVNQALDGGDVELATRWLEANRLWLDWSQSVAGEVEHHVDLARLNSVSLRWDDAINNAERAVQLSAQPEQPLARIAALRMRGILASDCGRQAAAESDFRAALALADACAAPFERARTLLEIAIAKIDVGEDVVSEACAIGTRLGATSLLQKLGSVLDQDRVGVLPQSDLTARERDVLNLVAMGLTDVEIGLRLFISHRTVSQHLRSVYAKLDIHSRAAATRFVIEHERV
jgi:DNA-binding NarL/FixJ family response regulator